MKIYDVGDLTKEKLQVLEQNEDIAHAKYSPSKLKSIILCPGSKKYIDRPNPGSSYASAGTWLHHLVPLLANTAPGVDWSEVDYIKCVPPLDDDESDAVLAALLEIQKQRSNYEHDTFDMGFEQFVQTPDPNVFGTADFIIYNKTHCTLIDWKFGKGVKVDDFTQLRAYAKGIENTIKSFDSYTLIVFQPMYHDGFHYASEVITREELSTWWNDVVQPALYKHHNYNASTEACRWCLGKSECRVRYNQVLEAATKMFADEPVLTEEKLGLWNQRAQIIAYLKEIEEELKSLAATGNLPGYKVVAGRSNSAWINSTQAEALMKTALKDEAYTRKLISPAQARKKFKGRSKEDLEALESLIHKPVGKPNLVPESDARPAMASAVFAAFVEDTNNAH